jgi:hypothetical protein
MTYSVKQHVKIDLRANGVEHILDLKPGDHELDPAVAELLVAQGIATPKAAKTSKTDPTPAIETSEE